MTLTSYCPECDNPDPNGCDHDIGHRYLDPITYERITDDDGKVIGYRVPDSERERWDSDVASVHPRAATTRPGPPSLDILTAELERIVYIDEPLRTLIASSYDTNPYQTWQLVENIKRRTATLDNPAGVLVVELRKIT